jgi:uncharacterized RDD family membrane protein YckC
MRNTQHVTDTQLHARQHFEQASTLEQQADYQTALEECATAIRLDPGFADAHNLRGGILESLEQKEEAIGAYREVIRLGPVFKEAIENLRDAEKELLESKYKTLNIEGKKFGIQSGASIIDAVTLFSVGLAVQFGVGLLIGVVLILSGREFRMDAQSSTQCLGLMVGLFLSSLYFVVFEWLCGVTPGKLMLGLRVVKESVEPCDFRAAIIRALLRYLDGFFFGILAYGSMKAPLYQRVGDKAAKTVGLARGQPLFSSLALDGGFSCRRDCILQ